MPKALVRKRCFVQMTGYEPVGPEHQHRRFIREMARFQKAWNVQGEVSPPTLSADGAVANWTVETCGPNWRVTTEFHWFRWDDFVASRHGRERLVAISARHRRVDGVRADGTVVQIFHRGMAIRRIFSLSAGLSFSGWFGCRLRRRDLPSSTSACRITWCSRRCFGWRSSSALALDLRAAWSISATRSTIGISRAISSIACGRGSKSGLTVLRTNWCALSRETDADEIIVDGHSLGAPLSLVVRRPRAATRSAARRRGKPLHLVSSGSSLLKVALHPAAGWLREAVGRMAKAPADLLGRIPGAGRRHQRLQGRSGRGAGHAGDRQADRENHSHPHDGGGAHLPALPSEFPAHPPPGGHGQRAALFL